MAGKVKHFLKIYLKELLLIAYLFSGLGHYLERISSLGSTLKLAVYLGLFGLCLLGLYMASNIRNTPVRIAYGILLASSAFLFDSFANITASFLTYSAFLSQFYASGFIGDAVRHFRDLLLLSSVAPMFLLVGIVLKPMRPGVVSDRRAMLAPVLVLAVLVVVMFSRGGDGGRGLPSSYIPLAYSVLMQYEAVTGVVAERQDVTLGRSPGKIDYDIVLIVDESIASSYLDINNESGVQTGLGHEFESFKVYNFGYAASITNCSTETNLSLRYGGTRDNYLLALSQMPSIWAYAKKAGLRTVYIDSQKTDGELHNNMTRDEAAEIDEFVQFDDVPVVERDIAAARKIADLTHNGIREFIYVNKLGGHFPVHDKFPDQFVAYEPILHRGQYTHVSDTGSREGFVGDEHDWIRYRNSYRNTILWNVGYFFQQLLASASSEAVIIYTSDHGQDLHERGNPGVGTHCSSDPVPEEGLVPLLVIQGRPVDTMNFANNLAANRNRASHYNIFPTLLLLMQYQRDQVAGFYGTSLDEQTEDDMTFNVNYHARLGKAPIWKRIDVDAIVVPPTTDFVHDEGLVTLQPDARLAN